MKGEGRPSCLFLQASHEDGMSSRRWLQPKGRLWCVWVESHRRFRLFISVLVKKGSWCAHERVGFQFHLPGPRRGRTYCHFPVTSLDPKTAWRFSWEKRRLPFLETRHESWYFPASAYLSCAMIQDQLTQPENGHLIVPTLLPPVPLVMMPTLVLTAMFQTMVPATTQQQPRWRPQHITQHGMSQQFPGT